MDGALACEPKGPWLEVCKQQPIYASLAHQCFSPCLPLSPKINKQNLKKKKLIMDMILTCPLLGLHNSSPGARPQQCVGFLGVLIRLSSGPTLCEADVLYRLLNTKEYVCAPCAPPVRPRTRRRHSITATTCSDTSDLGQLQPPGTEPRT